MDRIIFITINLAPDASGVKILKRLEEELKQSLYAHFSLVGFVHRNSSKENHTYIVHIKYG